MGVGNCPVASDPSRRVRRDFEGTSRYSNRAADRTQDNSGRSRYSTSIRWERGTSNLRPLERRIMARGRRPSRFASQRTPTTGRAPSASSMLGGSRPGPLRFVVGRWGGHDVERPVEWFVAVTSLVVGASHIARAGDWVEVYARLHRAGRPGAFANGAMSLLVGAAVVAGHGGWSWPGAVLTAFGWLLVLKGSLSLLAPGLALRSMERGSVEGHVRRRRALPGGRRNLGRVLPLAGRPTRLTRRCTFRCASSSRFRHAVRMRSIDPAVSLPGHLTNSAVTREHPHRRHSSR